MDFTKIKEFAVNKGVLQSAIEIFIILIIVFLATRIINMLIINVSNRMKKKKPGDGEFAKRVETLRVVFKYVYQIVVFVIAGIIILGEMGIEIGPILAAAGVVGIAVGFGAQSLVKDIISGSFLLLQDQLRVGDWVEIAGKDGKV